jgi:hypothetical protein
MGHDQVERPLAPQCNKAIKQRNRVRPTRDAHHYGVAGRQHVVTPDSRLNRRQKLLFPFKHDHQIGKILNFLKNLSQGKRGVLFFCR